MAFFHIDATILFGFVPYVATPLAYEDLTFTDANGQSAQKVTSKKLTIGVIYRMGYSHNPRRNLAIAHQFTLYS